VALSGIDVKEALGRGRGERAGGRGEVYGAREESVAGRCVAALASATWCALGSEYAWLRVALRSLAGARRACQRVGFTFVMLDRPRPGAGPPVGLMRDRRVAS
jgi:hypothetical protein